MERKEGQEITIFGVTIAVDDVPSEYPVVARTDNNSNQTSAGSSVPVSTSQVILIPVPVPTETVVPEAAGITIFGVTIAAAEEVPYEYRVVAQTSAGSSVPVSTFQVIPIPVPVPPEPVVSEAAGISNIGVTIAAAEDVPSEYRVVARTDNNPNQNSAGSSVPVSTSQVIPNPIPVSVPPEPVVSEAAGITNIGVTISVDDVPSEYPVVARTDNNSNQTSAGSSVPVSTSQVIPNPIPVSVPPEPVVSEAAGITNIGVTIAAAEDVPYRVVARTDNNPNQTSAGSSVPVSTSQVILYPIPTRILPEPVVSPAPGISGLFSPSEKKRRGRPRKYAIDGSVLPGSVLSPTPTSSSVPVQEPPPSVIVEKKEQVGSAVDDHNSVSCLIPHVITVNRGEDVTSRITSFCQRESRSICFLSAIGFFATVTLRQQNSSGGTLTYEGKFEILSLTGSYTPCQLGGIKKTSGGMSVSFASQAGRIFGGGIAGSLVAASPIQIVLGTWKPELELK